MERKNSLIVTASKDIVHIGESVLTYIDLSTKRPFAYPAGVAEKNDTVLYFSRDISESQGELFEKIGISARWGRHCALFLGVYENAEVQPIEKYGKELFSGEKSVLLDTFFFGNDVRVAWDENKMTLRLWVNDQEIDCCLANYCDQLLVFNESGIRYFRDDRKESRGDGNRAVLDGQPFHSYVRMDELCRVPLEELFSGDVRSHVEQLKHDEETIFFRGDGAVLLQCREWHLGNQRYTGYCFLSQQDILERMHQEASIYHRLYRVREERMKNSRMSTAFRLWGNDANLSRVKHLLQKACDTSVTVLLTGESGTGKTFLAREIHKNGRRGNQSFVHVNCAAIPYQLIESELFGYEDGAFTGAKKGGKKGYFEMACEGTIFLDEIAELPLPLQGKLLEVIQSRTFYRVGGTEKISVNVRLIAATNRNLRELVDAREFREDLYYRINVFPIELPPLRSRKGAIFAIVTDILPEICEKVELEPLRVSPQALEKLKGYGWPGNIRELENVLEKASIMSDGKIILPEDVMLPRAAVSAAGAVTLKEIREQCEKQAIIAALTKYGGDRGMTARHLDIGRTNLFDKIRKYEIRERWIGGEDDTE